MIREISFVIPAYNEEDNIASVVAACKSVAERISRNYEIIVVNDGSTDRTRETVENLVAEDPHILLVNHATNRGIAETMRTGFAATRYQYIFYTDGDCQFDVSEIKMLLPYCQDCDFVVGYRTHRADPIHRKITAFLYNFLIRRFFHISVRDVNCAFKLVKRESLCKLTVRANSAFYFAELLTQAIRSGMTVCEVPVRHYPRRFGRPTGNNIGVVIKALYDLVSYLLSADQPGFSRRAQPQRRQR